MKYAAVTLICLLLNITPVASVDGQGESQAGVDLSVDFAPPDLSAFSLLGVGPDKIARPGNVKELALSVLSGGNPGDIASNIAIEWSPTSSLGADDLESYKKNRLWRNLQISLATAADSFGTNVGMGIRWVPIDGSDPALDDELDREIDQIFALWDAQTAEVEDQTTFLNRVRDVLLPILQNQDVESIGDELRRLRSVFDFERTDLLGRPEEEVAEETFEALADSARTIDIELNELSGAERSDLLGLCGRYAVSMGTRSEPVDIDQAVGQRVKEAKERFKKRAWNATVVHLATGVVARSPGSTWESLRLFSWNSYAGCALKLKSTGQLILQGRFELRTRQESSIDYTYSGGLRVLLGGSDMRLNGEIAYQKLEAVCGCDSDEIWRYALGGELKLTDDLWLELSIGKESVPGDSGDAKIISLANIKYGLGRKILK